MAKKSCEDKIPSCAWLKAGTAEREMANGAVRFRSPPLRPAKFKDLRVERRRLRPLQLRDWRLIRAFPAASERTITKLTSSENSLRPSGMTLIISTRVGAHAFAPFWADHSASGAS